MRVPLFLLTFSKRQVNDQPARNGHSIDLIISPCGVKWHLTRTKNCTILSLYLAIFVGFVISYCLIVIVVFSEAGAVISFESNGGV
jgi:hypothetical protein